MSKAKEIKKEMKKLGYKIRLASELKKMQKLRTNVFAINYLLDGGIYQGEGGHRIELFGGEDTTKTTVTLLIIAQYQSLNKKCLFINAERTFDPTWSEILGVDTSKLYISEPDSLEQCGNILADSISKYDLIAMDSIPSLITNEELDNELEQKHMASQAKVYSPMTRKIYAAFKENNTTLIFINQLREKIGIMFGNPYNTPGGRAIKHMFHSRIEFKVGKTIVTGTDENKEIIGKEILINCKKNKRGKPHRTASFNFYLNGHIDNNRSLLFAGIKYGLIDYNGKTYVYKNHKVVGQDNFLKQLTEQEWQKLEDELWERIK